MPMKQKSAVFLTLIFSLAILLSGGCSLIPTSFEEPTVKLTNLRMLPTQGMSLPFEVEMAVDNPNDYVIELQALHYRVVVEGYELAEGRYDSTVTLGANDQTRINLPVQLNLLGGLEFIANTMQTPRDAVAYELIVNVDVKRPRVGKKTLSRKSTIQLDR